MPNAQNKRAPGGIRRRYVPSWEKAEFVIRSLLYGEKSVAELTEQFMKIYGMKYSTARSSASNTVNTLIDYGVLDYVRTDSRGSKVVDISPNGFMVLIKLLLEEPRLFNALEIDDIIEALEVRDKKRLADLVRLAKKIIRPVEENEGKAEFEGVEVDILSALSVESLFEGREIIDWDELEEKLVDMLVSHIREEYLERAGKTYELAELIRKLGKNEVAALGRVLFAMEDKLSDEINRLQRIIGQVQDLKKVVLDRVGEAANR